MTAPLRVPITAPLFRNRWVLRTLSERRDPVLGLLLCPFRRVLRDLEEIMLELGVTVDHTTLNRGATR